MKKRVHEKTHKDVRSQRNQTYHISKSQSRMSTDLLIKGLECKIRRWAVNLGTLECTYYFLTPSVSYVVM